MLISGYDNPAGVLRALPPYVNVGFDFDGRFVSGLTRDLPQFPGSGWSRRVTTDSGYELFVSEDTPLEGLVLGECEVPVDVELLAECVDRLLG